MLRISAFDTRSINLVNLGRDKVIPGLKNHLESKQLIETFIARTKADTRIGGTLSLYNDKEDFIALPSLLLSKAAFYSVTFHELVLDFEPQALHAEFQVMDFASMNMKEPDGKTQT